MFRKLGKNCTLLSLDMVSFHLYSGDVYFGVFDSPAQAEDFVKYFVKD